ncbi:MAG: hypothetical protein QM762_14340 [Chryseolinea sp.]
MKLLFISAFLCVATPRLFAQNSDLVPAQLVTTSGDTLQGLIKPRDWSGVKQVDFTTSAQAATKSYDLASIQSLYLKDAGEYYYAATVEIDKKPIQINNLERTGARHIVSETVLLELIVRGKLNLYAYRDENHKSHFFIKEPQKEITELPYVRYYSAEGSVVNMPFYLNVLKDLTKDCDAVTIRDQDYERKPLTKIVTDYNRCVGVSVETETKTKQGRSKLNLSIVAGAKYSGFTFDGVDNAMKANGFNNPKGASTANFERATNMVAGLNFEFQPRNPTRKVRLGFGLQWTQAGAFTGLSEPNAVTQRRYSAKFNYLTVGPMFKYQIVRRSNWNIYAKASLAALYLIHYEQNAAIIDLPTHTEKDADFMDYRALGLDFAFHAGIAYKRASFEIGYQRDTMYGEVQSSATTAGLVGLLSYRIF